MLTGLPKAEKKQRLREMRWALKVHRVKFQNEPHNIEKMYKRLLVKLEQKGE